MTDKACGICIKRHLAAAGLECRANPPTANDYGAFGRFPLVRPDDYCHDRFEAEASPQPASAGRARRAPAQGGQELPL